MKINKKIPYQQPYWGLKTKKAHLFHPNFIQQSSSVSIALINQFQFTVQSKASCQIQIGAYSTSAAPNANLKLFAFTLDDWCIVLSVICYECGFLTRHILIAQ